MTDRERLTELLNDFTYDIISCYTCEILDRDCAACENEKLADYLLEHGVIVMPCKVGDTVYWLDNKKIKHCEVFEISIHSDGILVHTGIQFCLGAEQIFLTREEAEKARKEK